MLRIIAFLFLVQYNCIFGFLSRDDGSKTNLQKPTNSAEVTITNSTIEQPLDHFDKNESRTWKIWYFQTLDHFRLGGPLYIFIGGEGKLGKHFLTEGLMSDLGKETHGALFKTEHRYYGHSIPIDYTDRSNLRYLSSRQALADLARLVVMLKAKQEFASSKVVMVGGSYSGNLATWFRLLYPNLADAAIASSAPVRAKVDFYEYLETVGDDYRKYGATGCYDAITQMFQDYEESFKTAKGIDKLKKDFSVCKDTDLSKIENKQYFFLFQINQFAHNSQRAGPAAIKRHCEEIMNKSYSTADKDKNKFIDTTDLPKCNNYTFPGAFAPECFVWSYQSCTEFAKFRTTTSDKQPFPNTVPIEFYYKMCASVYNLSKEDIKAGVDRTNKVYGGLKPNVTRVVFTNGAVDPYHRMGVLKDLNEEAPARVTPGATHCEDLEKDEAKDSKELRETRRFVMDWV